MNVYKYIALAAVGLTAACTTNDQGKKVVDYEQVKFWTMVTCAVTPTVAQVAQLYTDNKNVVTTKDAVALLCAATLPLIPDAAVPVKK